MDPNQIISEAWQESASDPDDKNSTPENTYAYVRRYADGRVVTQYFRRNQQGVVREVTSINADQERRFRAQQGSGPPGGKPYIDEEGPNGRRLGWDPNAYGPGQGGYTRDIGSSPSAQAVAAGASDTKPLEGYPGWAVRTTKVGNDTRTVFVNPHGQEAPDPRPSAAAGASDSKPLEGYPGWSVRTTKVGNASRTVFVNPAGAEAPDPRPATASLPTSTTLKPDGQGGTIAIQTMPDGSIKTTPVPGLPSDRPTPERVTVNGVVYERDPRTGEYAPARGLPSLGQATAGGPSMPEIVLGQSQEALRRYHEALANDPTLSPEQRQRRFAEAVSVANIAASEAQTAQRERESARNVEYNTATNRLQYAQSGMGQALSFVSDLNGKLPVGSDLGGKAFAALLGLQMIRERQSGITRVTGDGMSAQPIFPPRSGQVTGDVPRPPSPDISSADLSNAAALETKRQEIMANPVFRPQPPAAYPGAELAPTERASGGGAPAVAPPPNALGAAPPPAARVPYVPPRPSPSPGPGAASSSAATAPTDLITIRRKPGTGGVAGAEMEIPRDRWDALGPVGWQDLYDVVNARSGVTSTPTEPTRSTPPPPPPPPPAADPSWYGSGQDTQGMAPGSDPFDSQAPSGQTFGVMAALRPPPLPEAPPSSYGLPMGVSTEAPPMAAMQRAQIAATPPWRMDEQQYRYAVENGLEDEFWRVG